MQSLHIRARIDEGAVALRAFKGNSIERTNNWRV
jgi:hypothetical protein